MGRSHITPIQQPDDNTCGPAALKLALEILGKRKSLESLIKLCKTGRNGTSTQNLIKAINKLGLPVLAVEYTTLRHLQSALHYKPNHPRAILVSYLYDLDEESQPHPESGHWATVSAYLSSKGRIVLLDSSTAQKKSYDWSEFRERWLDYDFKRQNLNTSDKQFRLVRKWQVQLMLVIANTEEDLPKFKIETAKLFSPHVLQ